MGSPPPFQVASRPQSNGAVRVCAHLFAIPIPWGGPGSPLPAFLFFHRGRLPFRRCLRFWLCLETSTGVALY